MKHPLEVIPNHPQVYRSSCPAWGLEALVKFTGNELPSPSPYQDACQKGCNFQQASLDDMQKRWSIKTQQHEFKDDLGGFEREARKSIAKNYYPLLTVFSGMYPTWDGKYHVDSHVFVTVESAGKLEFLTWNFFEKKMARVSWDIMSEYHHDWVHSAFVPEQHWAHGLFYSLPE